MSSSEDFLFRGPLKDTAPFVAELIAREEERQKRKLIMIPSESCAPKAVRDALGSVFQNVYAEGYPRERTMRYSEELLLDQSHCLVYYRRYANRRFYKGVDYVDIIEGLAARRAAMCFARPGLSDTDIYVNVQALSGSAANLSIYDALLRDGDVIMGLDLFQGGHLTHGSEFNQSGKRYNVVSYGVDPKTEKLNYDAIRDLALEFRPKLIIAGYTSYPWAPDWGRFREIADEAGAYLMADIAHSAGLVIGGVYPNPVGTADVTVFTTHKTLGGPRGAVIITTDEETAALIDNSVFPGAQGGPHINKMAALAVVFKIAGTKQFRKLQEKTVENARVLAEAFTENGLKVVYGGTDTHIVMVDVHSFGLDPKERNRFTPGIPLRGEIAARILDLAGIVVNKNTIPGDTMTALAHGIRFGTPWVTQRGFGPEEMKEIAKITSEVVSSIHPFSYIGVGNELPRGKLGIDALEQAKAGVAVLAERAGFDLDVEHSEYPHYWCEDEQREGERRYIRVSGWRAEACLQELCTVNISALEKNKAVRTFFLDAGGKVLSDCVVMKHEPDLHGRQRYVLAPLTGACRLLLWLRGTADGYILFDTGDVFRKIQGPVVVEEIDESELTGQSAELEAAFPPDPVSPGREGAEAHKAFPKQFDLSVPYFVGQAELTASQAALTAGLAGPSEGPAEIWSYAGPREDGLKKTELNSIHRELGAKMVPFAGWDMPVWYSSVSEEHGAVRKAAGLFDVSHMGCFEVTGPHALEFLDTVTGNYIHWLEDLDSCYSYLFDIDGNIIDDIMVYRFSAERFLVVVNASNEEKDWDWLTAVNEGRVVIDKERPSVRPASQAELINLKSEEAGTRQLRGIALQGPASKRILSACISLPEEKSKIDKLRRTRCTEAEMDGFAVIVTRTGYTGEKSGYELYVHPENLPLLWNRVMETGKDYGIRPCGLAARDSLRIEAGLPLYGHELAGTYNISPAEAGFAGYVKYHKPFFIGRDARLTGDMDRERELVRWRADKKGVRRPNPEDVIVNKNGIVIGNVTSCSIDAEGRLIGLGLVERKYTGTGLEIGIYLKKSGKKEGEKTPAEASVGDRLSMPVPAAILPRFMI